MKDNILHICDHAGLQYEEFCKGCIGEKPHPCDHPYFIRACRAFSVQCVLVGPKIPDFPKELFEI